MKDLVSLKSEEVVRANIHSCLKTDALRWYTHELTRAEKDLMQECSLEVGWFKMLTNRFKPNRADALRQLDSTTYGWRDVRAGRTPRVYAQTMLRLLKSTGTSNTQDQILKMVDNIDASLARDLGDPSILGLAEFMEKLDFCYRTWKRQADERNLPAASSSL